MRAFVALLPGQGSHGDERQHSGEEPPAADPAFHAFRLRGTLRSPTGSICMAILVFTVTITADIA